LIEHKHSTDVEPPHPLHPPRNCVSLHLRRRRSQRRSSAWCQYNPPAPLKSTRMNAQLNPRRGRVLAPGRRRGPLEQDDTLGPRSRARSLAGAMESAAAGAGAEKLATGRGGGEPPSGVLAALAYPYTATSGWVGKLSDTISWQLVAFVGGAWPYCSPPPQPAPLPPLLPPPPPPLPPPPPPSRQVMQLKKPSRNAT
jgi:hypothetical protein